MSIKYKILLPMLITLAVATALVGIVGQRSLSAAWELVSVTEDALKANEAARAAHDGFARGEVILGRVTAMTDLLDPARIESDFGAVAAQVETSIGRLKAASRSERLGVLSAQASTVAAQWRTDAEILLGIRPAREIPTTELMSRHSRSLRAHLDEAVTLAGQDARTDMAAAEGTITRQLWLILGIGFVAGGVGVVAAFLVAGSLSKPLIRLTRDAGRLAAGDVTVTLADGGRRDEIGALVAAVQVFRDGLVRTRELEAEAELARAGVEAQRKAGMRDLADGFERAVGGIIGTVATAADDLQANARSMTASATEAVEQSGTVAASAGDAASNVGMVAAAAEELGASVQEVSRQVEGSAHLTRLAVTEASQTAALVRELSEAAARIGDVTAMISTVASQTNLLALNATIEAARAGAAGRGFAVVASEVKELAGQTARATDEIGTQIGRIQASTGQAVQVIDRIAARIVEISGMATMISASVDQQGAAIQEIARNAGRAAAGTSLVNTNIGGVAGVAGRTGTAASQVLSSASELSRQSGHLKEEVARFLANVRAA